MPQKKTKITEEMRKALKRQAAEPDVESEAQTSGGPSNANPEGNRSNEGTGSPGGHGRGGKASRG